MNGDCKRAVVLIEKLFDGEASSEERREADAHLDGCAACRAHLEFLASLAERVRELPPPEPPEAYWEQLPRRIRSRIEAERGPSAHGFFRKLFSPGGMRPARWAPALALAASLVGVVALGVRFLRETQSPGSVEPRARVDQRASAPREAPEAEEPTQERASAPARAEAPSPTSPPRSEKALEAQAETPAPPMARDEKLASNAAQKTESLEVADAARSRMEREDLATEASPTASSAFTVGEAADPAAVRVRRPAAAPAELSRTAGSSTGAADCSAFRDALSSWTLEGGESEIENQARKNDLRYRLARCSIDRYRREGGEALRRTALGDGDGFLTFEKEGRRAEEIRAELERIRVEKK